MENNDSLNNYFVNVDKLVDFLNERLKIGEIDVEQIKKGETVKLDMNYVVGMKEMIDFLESNTVFSFHQDKDHLVKLINQN